METLKKVKLKKNGGLDIDYQQPDPQDNSQIANQAQYNRIPHEHLVGAIEGLKPFLAKSHNLFSFEKWNKEMMSEAEYKAMDALEKLFGEAKQTILNSVDVTGIFFSGQDNPDANDDSVDANFGVIITGTHNCGGTKVAFNSPRIILSRDTFGFEDELKRQIKKIKKEVHAYLYDGKRGKPKPIEGGLGLDEDEMLSGTGLEKEVDKKKTEKPKVEKAPAKKSSSKKK